MGRSARDGIWLSRCHAPSTDECTMQSEGLEAVVGGSRGQGASASVSAASGRAGGAESSQGPLVHLPKDASGIDWDFVVKTAKGRGEITCPICIGRLGRRGQSGGHLDRRYFMPHVMSSSHHVGCGSDSCLMIQLFFIHLGQKFKTIFGVLFFLCSFIYLLSF